MGAIRHMPLGDAVDEAAARRGDAIGWVFGDTEVSFTEMRLNADRIARALMQEGIEPGDVVAVWTPNLAEFTATQFACAKIGAIIVALNTRFRSFEIGHILKQSGAVALIMVERFLKHAYVDVLDELGLTASLAGGLVENPEYPRLRRIVSLEENCDERLLAWPRFLEAGEACSVESLKARQAGRTWSEPTLLQYTSGTTARPKGALIDHRYVLNAGFATFSGMGVQAGEAVLSTQPIYHIGGSCAASPTPLTLGCKMVMPVYYEAETVLRLIEKHRCVARTGFAAMYIMEMQHPDFTRYDMTSLRAGWCAGPDDLFRRIGQEYGIPYLVRLYSSTEVGCTIGHWDEPFEARIGTFGAPFEGTEIEIRDPETRAALPTGVIGEIAMRSWWQMIGYLGQPEETARVVDREGWVHTGDRGFLDEDGRLHFLGRYKDMMKVGGENVSAEEVAEFLMRHPKVAQAAVFGIPDPRLDEVPMAVVELKPGETATEQEIIRHCASAMANFRVPRQVRFTTEWPMTGSGKIQTHELRRIFAVHTDGVAGIAPMSRRADFAMRNGTEGGQEPHD